MATDWEIKGRSESCAVTNRPFQEGEYFYTLLFRDKTGFHRQDWSEEAWGKRDETIRPFSFWRSRFEPPAPPPPEPLAKESAEDLLRRFMQEEHSRHANARYILGVMLERKRILKQIESRSDTTGRTLIYEHTKTGEVFVIPDPQLRLDQIEAVQNEVVALLQ
jgi:hypothetical protein